jgi:hypothetical protein
MSSSNIMIKKPAISIVNRPGIAQRSLSTDLTDCHNPPVFPADNQRDGGSYPADRSRDRKRSLPDRSEIELSIFGPSQKAANGAGFARTTGSVVCLCASMHQELTGQGEKPSVRLSPIQRAV